MSASLACLILLQAGPVQEESLWDKYPWLSNLIVFLALLAIVVFIAWFVRGKSGGGADFTIHVDEQDVTFTGKFPPQMQTRVIEFLRQDVALPGSYKIRGHWEQSGANRLLIVAVQGDQARIMEQRIRNFLKLNLKPPR